MCSDSPLSWESHQRPLPCLCGISTFSCSTWTCNQEILPLILPSPAVHFISGQPQLHATSYSQLDMGNDIAVHGLVNKRLPDDHRGMTAQARKNRDGQQASEHLSSFLYGLGKAAHPISLDTNVTISKSQALGLIFSQVSPFPP